MSPSEHHYPLVSIIVPVFNAGKYLSEAIESVLQQEYKHWELILIDDGSTDNSMQVVEEYRSRYSDKIFCYSHENRVNKAAAASRNLGVSKVKGEMVAFLDADDVWLPRKLQEQVLIFIQNPEVSMICESSIYWYSWANQKAEDIEIAIGAAKDQAFLPPKLALVLYPLGRGDAPCPSGIIIKTSVLLKHNGFEDSFTGVHQVYEDQAFLIKIYLNEVVYISSLCNNLYRQRQNSVMDVAQESGHYHAARQFFLRWLKTYLQKNRIKDRKVLFLLWKAERFYKQKLLYKILAKIMSAKK